jgi:2-phospho-L-lactate guanylyltransferase
MHALLIPVKDLRRAKQRLAPHLSQQDRTSLAHAMFEDFCAAIVGTRLPEKVFVVTSFAPAIEVAAANKWEVVSEEQQESESASVDFASRICAARGVTSLARVPIDLPLITAADVDALFEANRAIAAARPGEPSMIIVPSRCGTGTNALLRTPPALFPSHFGPNSFSKHLAEARDCDAHTTILRNERLELDVDDWEDLKALAIRSDLPRHTARWLKSIGISKELNAAGTDTAAFAASA